MKVIYILIGCLIVSLTGCATTTEKERLDACEAKGVSRDACYLAERADRREEQRQLQEDLRRQNEQTVKNMNLLKNTNKLTK